MVVLSGAGSVPLIFEKGEGLACCETGGGFQVERQAAQLHVGCEPRGDAVRSEEIPLLCSNVHLRRLDLCSWLVRHN